MEMQFPRNAFHLDFHLCRNADTLKRLNDAEKLLKQQQADEYINMDVATEERNKGNEVRSFQASSLTLLFIFGVPKAHSKCPALQSPHAISFWAWACCFCIEAQSS